MLLPLLLALLPGDPPAGPAAGFATISAAEVEADILVLADARLEGRDTPSPGLSAAADHIERRLRAAGLAGASAEGAFRLPFEVATLTPDLERSRLQAAGPERIAEPGRDFVPVPLCEGQAEGELVFLGFGIESHDDRYDDVRGELDGRIALIVESEPRHKRLFEGPEASPAADLHRKLSTLREAGAAGALVVRRPPPGAETAPPLGFRHTWARWRVETRPPEQPADLPALEITAGLAAELAGFDVLEAAAKVDASGKAPRRVDTGRQLSLAAHTRRSDTARADNVAGIVRGRDSQATGEFVVLGAHYDHIGVDTRGRIGFGADDNASGTAALLELAEALATAGPRRSVLVAFFAGEEDGLLGSAAFCKDPPVPVESMVAMLNMDMIGRGDVEGVAVLGLLENPALDDVLDRALELQATRVRKLTRREGQELFERSDHYNFHRLGVPTLFIFEGLPIDANADYHMWTDTPERVDMEKVARTARLVFNTAWLLAEDEGRPPPPQRKGR